MIPGGKKSKKVDKSPLFLKESRYLKNQTTNKCMQLNLMIFNISFSNFMLSGGKKCPNLRKFLHNQTTHKNSFYVSIG